MSAGGITRRLALAAATSLALGLFGVAAASAASTMCKEQTLSGEIKGSITAGPGCVLEEATVEGGVAVKPGGSLVTQPRTTVVIGGGVVSKEATRVLMEAGGTIGRSVNLQGTTGIAAVAASEVKGSVVISNGNALVEVAGETVDGNVKFHNNVGAEEPFGGFVAAVDSVHVGGEVTITENSLKGTERNTLEVDGVSAGGNVEVRGNTLAATSNQNAMDVSRNTVGGRVVVRQNTLEAAPDLLRMEVAENVITGVLQCEGNAPAPELALGGPNTASKKYGQCAAL
jgi:hypothetical protein